MNSYGPALEAELHYRRELLTEQFHPQTQRATRQTPNHPDRWINRLRAVATPSGRTAHQQWATMAR